MLLISHCCCVLAGKEARKGGAGFFIAAASTHYQDLSEEGKSQLKTAADNLNESTKTLGVACRRKKASKIFVKIQKQVFKFLINS